MKSISTHWIIIFILSNICELMCIRKIMKLLNIQNISGGFGKGIYSYTVRQITSRKRSSCIWTCRSSKRFWWCEEAREWMFQREQRPQVRKLDHWFKEIVSIIYHVYKLFGVTIFFNQSFQRTFGCSRKGDTNQISSTISWRT